MKANTRGISWLIISAFLLLHTISVSAFTVHNSEYDFTMEVPDEFEAFDFLAPHSGPTLKFVKKNTLYGFRWTNPENGVYTYILIERSSWLMTNNPAPDKDLSVLESAWQGLDINLYRQENGFYKNKATVLTLTAAIPLKAGPIQIKLSGPPAKEDEMKSILISMLDSLDSDAGLLASTSKYSFLLVPLGALGFAIYTIRKSS